MINVYIWGTGTIANQCINDIKTEVNILGFVESHSEQGKTFKGKAVLSGDEVLEKEYDYIIIATSFYEEIIDEFFESVEKVIIYPYDVVFVDNSIRFKRRYTNPCSLFFSDDKMKSIDESRKYVPYISLDYEGLSFIFDSHEYLMPAEMIFRNEVYSKDEMLFYNSFLKADTGYFLDIGANVGTSTIYFRKKLKTNYSYYAFEPLSVNYKYLRLNILANECEDVVAINTGISDENIYLDMGVIEGSFGSSYIMNDHNNERKVEHCKFERLDSFVADNGISPNDIAGIWIDVQNHEYEVLKGGVETFRNSACPVYMEFNYKAYCENGIYNDFVNDLANLYKSFICYEQYEKGRKDQRPINELYGLKNEFSENMYFCNILLLK